jgi:hypothetical protein
VFHSDDARQQLADYCVGGLKGYTGPVDAVLKGKKSGSSGGGGGGEATSPVLYVVGFVALSAMVYLFVL